MPGSQNTASGGRSGNPGETGFPAAIRHHIQAAIGERMIASLRSRLLRSRSRATATSIAIGPDPSLVRPSFHDRSRWVVVSLLFVRIAR